MSQRSMTVAVAAVVSVHPTGALLPHRAAVLGSLGPYTADSIRTT